MRSSTAKNREWSEGLYSDFIIYNPLSSMNFMVTLVLLVPQSSWSQQRSGPRGHCTHSRFASQTTNPKFQGNGNPFIGQQANLCNFCPGERHDLYFTGQ